MIVTKIFKVANATRVKFHNISSEAKIWVDRR